MNRNLICPVHGRRWIISTALLLLFATSAFAQARAESYVVTITNAIGTVVRSDTYPVSGMNCDDTQDIATPLVSVLNPTLIRWLNFLDPTRHCRLDNSAQVQQLPDGAGYRASVHLMMRDTVTNALLIGPESAFGNVFEKAGSSTQPPPNVVPMITGVQSLP